MIVLLGLALVAAGHACTIDGWSIDPDPRGLYVRAEPGKGARVVGTLPPFVTDRDGDYGPAFRISAAQDGWLKIARASDAWAPKPRPVFGGTGWVHGSRVRLTVQSGVGRTAPSTAAPVVVDTGDQWLSDVGRVMAVTDCAGTFVRVRYHLPATARVKGARDGEAWFTAACGEQRTTCDGVR